MQSRRDIQKELSEISPLLAGFDPSDSGFEVPSGYFAEFAGNLLRRIKSGETGVDPDPSFLEEAGRKLMYAVPDAYFDNFPEIMMRRVRALQAGSASEELDMLSPLLGGLDKKTPYSAPPGYFTELSGNMVEGLKALDSVQHELKAEHFPSILDGLNNKITYQVPEKYFERLPERMLEAAKAQTQAPVFALGTRRSWMKYAAAAAVTGMIVVGSYLVFNSRSVPSGATPANASLSTVSDQEILTFLDTHNVPLADNNSLATLEPGESDSNDLLGNVSDEELQKYLDEDISKKESMAN